MALSVAVPDTSFAQHNASKSNPEPVQAKTSSGLGGLFGRIRQKLGI